MFREVICEVVGTFSPVDEKMPLFQAVTKPIKTHVHGFGSSLFDGFVAYAGSTGIVGLDGCCWLGVPHVFEGCAEHGGFFAVEEKGAELGFGDGGEDGGHHGGVDVNCAIGWRRSGFGIRGTEGIGEGVAEEEETARAGPSFLFG